MAACDAEDALYRTPEDPPVRVLAGRGEES
jgi:hypothetical protein